jgi:hypothetical protein
MNFRCLSGRKCRGAGMEIRYPIVHGFTEKENRQDYAATEVPADAS